MPKSKSYETMLIKSLKSKKEAAAYLNAALHECADGSVESQKLFLMALKNISLARGSIKRSSAATRNASNS